MAALEVILLAYFIYVVGYTFIFALAGFNYKNAEYDHPAMYRKFAVLIPSYKEDAVILDVAVKALRQNYPTKAFEVFIIADSLQRATIEKLEKLSLTVIEVAFENSTKVRSLNSALALIPDGEFDLAVILDADNVMEGNFLKKMNAMIVSNDYKAVQGQRKPKNQQNNLAFLDGVSEAINNHIYRQGSIGLGLSSSISGSGVVFDFRILKDKLRHMNSVGGFDRELELRLLLDGVRVQYYKDAVVYDEKVSKTTNFQNQRRRWIFSQYFYLQKYFKQGCSALLKGEITFFNSAVLRNIQLPRLINLGLITIVTLLSPFLDAYLQFGYGVWLMLFSAYAVAIFVSIPREYYSMRMLNAFVEIPSLFVRMLFLLFKLKGANKKFIHTQHGVVTQEQ